MLLSLLLSFFTFATIVDYVMHFKVSPQKANYERRVDVNLACFDPKEVNANEVVLIDDHSLTLNITFTQTKAIQILQPKSKTFFLQEKCNLYKNGQLIAYVYPKEKGNYYDFFFVALDPKARYNLVCKFNLSPNFDEKSIKPAIVNNYDWREYLSVFFPLGEFELTPKIRFELDNFFKVIPKDKICILYLIGYADSTPIVKPETLKKVKSNRDLAYKRVKNVLDYLLANEKLNYKPVSEEKLLKEFENKRKEYKNTLNKTGQNVENESETSNSNESNSSELNGIYDILNNLSEKMENKNVSK